MVLRDGKIFEAALARIGEVSPEVAEYEAAALRQHVSLQVEQ